MACGSPISSAGSWISPPPPTTASTKPAASAARPSSTSTVRVGSSTGDPRLGSVRIVSLLPSTTEILFALGAGDDVVGVTFECDTPAEARSRTVVSTSAMPEGLTPAEIDAYVVAAVGRGDDLYHLAADALRSLDPTLVVTQDLCAVCAVDVTTVDAALAHLGCRAEVLTIDPHTLEEVLDSVLLLGRATGRDEAAAELVGSLRLRMAAVWRSSLGRPGRGSRCSSGPTRRTPRDTGSPRWSSSPAARTSSAPPARSRSGSPGTTCTPPGRTWSWWPPAATTARRPGAGRPAGRRRAPPRRGPRARGGRRRHVGPSRSAARRRRRGALGRAGGPPGPRSSDPHVVVPGAPGRPHGVTRRSLGGGRRVPSDAAPVAGENGDVVGAHMGHQ